MLVVIVEDHLLDVSQLLDKFLQLAHVLVVGCITVEFPVLGLNQLLGLLHINRNT